jgi:hypothetical protein
MDLSARNFFISSLVRAGRSAASIRFSMDSFI